MPSPMVDQRGLSASSHFFDDISFRSERDPGLQKLNSFHDQFSQGKNGMMVSPGSNLNSSSVLERSAKSGLPMSRTSLSIENVEKLKFGGEGIFDALMVSKESSHYHHRSRSDVCIRSGPISPGVIGDKIVANAAACESTLFSSSLSDMFGQKLRLFGKDALSDQPDIIDSVPEEEPYKSLEEIEAETIGNLLPDEDDLFSGVNDESRCNTNARKNDDLEDFDLFSSGGGMELERDEHLNSGLRTLDGDSGFFGGPKGKFPFVTQPSRTLFVRNINSNVDDSELKALFEQYGDIRTMYTACKHRGFVMISYFDLRAAQSAMQALQNWPLRLRKLDIHYSIPKVNASEKDIGHGTLMLSGLDSTILNDELKQIFGFYGDIKEIYESPEMKQLKFIEFYDVRAAEAALRALNRIDVAGKQIKIEQAHPSLIQQSHKGQDELELGQSIIDNFALRQKTTVSAGVIGSGLENGYNQAFQSGMPQALNTFTDNAFVHMNSSIHNTLRGQSAANVSGISESNKFVDAMKFASSPRFHPHSLPEYHDTLANGSPYNFSSTISNMTSSVNTGVTEASDSRHIQGMGSTANLTEFNAGGNGIRSHHGLYQMWNSSNLHQQPSSGTMLWQKRPSFVNLPQMPSLARTPPHMLRSQHMDHNVASAPVSPWGRQHSHLAESPDASGFGLGSVGSGGFQGSWHLLSPEFSPRLFPHASPKGTELPSNAGQSSPKQHGFPGRHSMNSMSKFDSANERMRNLYHRRSDTNNADKKQFELDLGRIMNGEDSRTTLMIKNIPNKYTSKMLLAAIDEQCRGTYDFLYLPIDFKNKCNVGYAFINMVDASQIIPFHQAFNGKKWEKFNSEKVASLAYARIQGKASLIAHFQNSSLMNEDKRCRPILFHTDGPNAGDPEPFPMGTNIRVRPGKSRTAGNDESRNQPSPRILINGVESPDGVDFA